MTLYVRTFATGLGTHFLLVDQEDGARPVIRGCGAPLYQLMSVPVRLVNPGDWFADDLKLGFVERVETAEFRLSGDGQLVRGLEIHTSESAPDLWVHQDVRIYRPVPRPMIMTHDAPVSVDKAVTPPSFDLAPAELSALWEVFYRHIGGVALVDDTPLHRVWTKLQAALPSHWKTPPHTMVNTNDQGILGHSGKAYAILHMIKPDDE